MPLADESQQSRILNALNDVDSQANMINSKSPPDMSQATPWWLPSITGSFFGFVFFVLTFTPSLVPRPPVFQGLLGGVAFFIGYAIGHCGVLLWRYLELPEVPRPWLRAANFVLALACLIFAASYISQATAWQNEVRARTCRRRRPQTSCK